MKNRNNQFQKITLLHNNNNKEPPLFVAISQGEFEIATELIEYDPRSVFRKDLMGNSALHIVFSKFDLTPKESKKFCQTLIHKSKCQLNEENIIKLTPLGLGARKRQKEAVRFAIEFNKIQLSKGKNELFDLSALGGELRMSVLHYTALISDLEIVQELVNQNLNLFVQDIKGRTPRDLVKNSLTSKFLLRQEKAVIRNQMKRHAVPLRNITPERRNYLMPGRTVPTINMFQRYKNNRPVAAKVRTSGYNRKCNKSVTEMNLKAKTYCSLREIKQAPLASFCGLFRTFTQDSLSYLNKYRIIYYLLARGDEQAQDMLVAFADYLPNSVGLKRDIFHILGVLQNETGLLSLEKQRPSPLAEHELFNALKYVQLQKSRKII